MHESFSKTPTSISIVKHNIKLEENRAFRIFEIIPPTTALSCLQHGITLSTISRHVICLALFVSLSVFLLVLFNTTLSGCWSSSSHPTIHPFPHISSLMPVTCHHHQTGVDTSPVSQASCPKHSSPRKVPEGYEASLIFPKRWLETQKKRHVEAKGKEKETLKTKAMKTMVAKKVLKEMVCVPKWADQHSLLLITGWFWRSWCR